MDRRYIVFSMIPNVIRRSIFKTKELENSSNTMDQLVTLQSKLRADCDKIEKLEMKIKNEIITLTKARIFIAVNISLIIYFLRSVKSLFRKSNQLNIKLIRRVFKLVFRSFIGCFAQRGRLESANFKSSLVIITLMTLLSVAILME